MDHIPTHYLGQKIVIHQVEKKSSKVYQGCLLEKNKSKIPVYILGKISGQTCCADCIAILRRQKEGENVLITVANHKIYRNQKIENYLYKLEQGKVHLLIRDHRVTRTHRGVYGVIMQQNKVLVIRKARGPYTGLYDLPGGSPEIGESPEQTVAREIREETNCTLCSVRNKRKKEVIFSDFTKESGELGVMQHFGILYDCTITGKPSQKGDGLDSNGAVWIERDKLSPNNATPFVLLGIRG